MLQTFQNHWQTLQLPNNAQLLVAVSGGIDSMVLCDLLLQSQLKFSIAHANFQLRGKDSDEDALFVEHFAKKHHLPFFSKQLAVEEFQEKNNASIQMAARTLRYAWFESLVRQHHFDYVLTAHHLNDSLETFFINLSRGTGLKGLTGIPTLHEIYLRPLLNFPKEWILTYAEENKIAWREDVSNASDDYVRNQIRHHITPVLEEIHPNFMGNFAQSLHYLKEEQQLLQNHLDFIRNQLFQNKEDHLTISIDALNQLSPLNTYLFYLFKDYGFQFPLELKKLMEAENNREIQSENYRLIKNRTHLILTQKRSEEVRSEIEIYQGQLIEKPLYLKVSISNCQDELATESLDAAQIRFPLRLRKPKHADSFFPMGMNGSKKLNKFLRDEKLSNLEKEQIWLLTDAKDDILYVLNRRIDERFKITEHTNNFLNIYLC
ncbi:MAG TPA: tRNA lysidine(34) synthetase TilS [Moheibacter sp.]|nr:tRNA lysidine(34) synthetase TilS [Moheibacter sp.]